VTRADLVVAAAEKYPDTEWSSPATVAAFRECYIQGRLDQAESDAHLAESNPGIEEGYGVWHALRIAAAIRKGVE